MEENLKENGEKRGPGRPPKNDEYTVQELTQMVETLAEELHRVSNPDKNKSGVIRKRTKEHVAYMRIYQGQTNGIVMRLYDVKEVQDKTENRRNIGLCKLEVYDPKTKTTKTHNDVNYLEFLEYAPKVLCNIEKIEKTLRIETEITHGGGGKGALYKQGPNNEYLVDAEFDYEVGYTDMEYTLRVMEGDYAGVVVTNSGDGLNI